MYKTNRETYTTYILYEIQETGTHIIRIFPDTEDMLEYFAWSLMERTPWGFLRMQPPKSMVDNMNVTGRDTCHSDPFDPEGLYTRPYILTDAAGRMIDIRNFMPDIMSKLRELVDTGYTGMRCTRKGQPYVYRKDPVPNIHRCSHRFLRHVRHWARSRREDCIPEYRQYVRKKAIVPNTWETEPFEQETKNWKDVGKRHHQWDKERKSHKKRR